MSATEAKVILVAWKAMPAHEVCDVMDFLVGLDWPISRGDLQAALSARFDWTIEVEDGQAYLVNAVSNLSVPDVTISQVRNQTFSASFRVTDVTPSASSDATAFLSDHFTLVVREGAARWEKQRMMREDDVTRARWDVSGGAQIDITMLPRSVSASFSTPQSVEVDRKLARYGH